MLAVEHRSSLYNFPINDNSLHTLLVAPATWFSPPSWRLADISPPGS